MDLRLSSLLTLIFLAAVGAEDGHPCPCIPSHLCPQSIGESSLDQKVTGPIEPCKELGTVHCCSISISRQEQSQLAVVAEHMEQEREMMSIINNALEKMGDHREDKSIDQTTRNKLNCNSKSCEAINGQFEEDKYKSGKHDSAEGKGSSPANDGGLRQSATQEALHKNSSSEKLIIVYAEKPNKNNLYFQKTNNPQIVLPAKESDEKTESIKDKSSADDEEGEPQESESSIDPKVISGDEKRNRFTPQVKKQPQAKPRFKPKERKHNLQQLFAKHRPSPLLSKPRTAVEKTANNSQAEDLIEDIELAASNLDEVQDLGIASTEEVDVEKSENYQINSPTVSENVEPESLNNSTSSRKVSFRSPPRRLTSKPTKPVDKPTGKSALELLKGRSKGKVEQTQQAEKTLRVNAEEAMMFTDIAQIMDAINLKVINDMIKTNFTLSANVSQAQKTNLPLKSYNSAINNRRAPSFPVRRNNQGTTSLLQNTGVSSSTDQNPEVQIKEPAKTTKFPQRAKFGSQSLVAKPLTAAQTNTDNLPKTPSASNNSPRRPFTRIRTRTQVKSTNPSDLSPVIPEVTPPPTTPLTNINRRLPLRQRIKTKLPTQNEQTEQTSPEKFSSALPEEITSELQKSEEDLEGSGSNFNYQHFAPPAMESGFQPMIQSRELNIVGPIPGGFHDPALGFNPVDDVGLELPRPEENFQPDLNTGRTFNNNRNPPTLLPPLVFPIAQPPTAPTPQLQVNIQKIPSFDNDSLLPPVQLPIPLHDNRSQHVKRPQQQADLTHIQKEFNQLKSQYDTLLSRYADTLSIYIGQYKKLINSSPPAIR